MADHDHPNYRGQVLDAAKDPLDLRDLYYEGSLNELKPWVDNRGKVPFIANQEKEGACTGFALAAVVNYLLHNRAGASQLKRRQGASARMMYEMAKRYDEWEGTNYEGSSVRAAVKGWHKHGVCPEWLWPYKTDEKSGRLTKKRQEAALDIPLGNYFRVRHLYISQLHSAICEADILYASASVHSGWFKPDPDTGRIPYRADKNGGHAFAIVGYDSEGLWIQNSWGRGWGLNGFGHLSYDDWFENGYDCWVARLGAKTTSVALAEGGPLGRALSFNYIPHEAVVMSTIKPHFVNLGNDGHLSQSGRYQTDDLDLNDIVRTVLDTTRKWPGKRKILLYAHGGLNTEKASATRVASMLPYFLQNQVYPIHFMWETGLWDSIKGIVADAQRHRRFGGVWDEAKERFQDLADEAIELASRQLGRPIWSQMKDNARGAVDHRWGGAFKLAKKLSSLRKAGAPDFELHLVGHSAGSILLGHLMRTLIDMKIPVQTISLFAPACSIQFFEDKFLSHLSGKAGTTRLTIFNLRDEIERKDHVAKIYNKSLLYLVSEAFERERKLPLLGMQKHVEASNVLSLLFGKPKKLTKHTAIYAHDRVSVTLKSSAESHGGFDNDVDTLNSTLRIITRKKRLKFPFKDTG